MSAPPLGGRLTIEYHERGITLTDSISTATSPLLIRWVGVVLLVGGIVVTILCLNTLVDRDHIVAALIAAACGGICIVRAKSATQRVACVRVEADRIYTQGSPNHDWLSGRFHPRKFETMHGSLTLQTGQFVRNVTVCYWWGIRFCLFTNLSPDEARWAVHELETALVKS